MRKIKETIIVLSAIVTTITGIIGYINFDWSKNLLENILEFKLIIAIVIAGIIIVIVTIKYFTYIRNFFKWLLMTYFKIAWKIIGEDIMIFIEDSKRKRIQAELKSNFDSDLELKHAIDTYFHDENKKKNFIENYICEIENFYKNNPDTWAVLYHFQKEKGIVEFIKYLEGFFEALSHWSPEKIYSWTLLSIKQKEAEFLECMKHVDNGKLKEFQIKCARYQSIIPEYVFFLDSQNYIQ
ncbi:MAG: hypothetical protein LBU89_11150 [Fibromonadaceae bacterium]|jgi:hypothetical protein|nr:hypothetical protein [Fibromonadaceae bacterium]